MRISDWSSDVCSSDLLEVALAEALVTLALDDLEEHRPDDVLGEDLQQAAAVRRRRAVDQDLAGREPREVLAVARQAAVDLLVVGIRHAFLESDALALEGRDGGIDVVGAERDVLDTLARSEERRVGKEWVSTCWTGWSP